MKYKTKLIDYTGCDPVIAEHLKRGEAILCKVCDFGHTQRGEALVIGYVRDASYPYITEMSCYRYANPIPTTKKVKKASEIVEWLEDNGYEPDSEGHWHKSECRSFIARMFHHCGRTPFIAFNWEPEWLEDSE